MERNIKKEKIAAVVVTYNRKELLKECLDAILRQTYSVDSIILVDNSSTDGTPEFLKDNKYIKSLPAYNISQYFTEEFEIGNLTSGDRVKVYYIRMIENTGGAGGFYEGLKKGYEEGFDLLWMMDDDVKPKENCLECLMKVYSKLSSEASALLPLRQNLKGEVIEWYPYFSKFFLRSRNTGPSKSNSFCFEGALINSILIKRIGLPKKDFFTVLDDTEYGLRISSICKTRYVSSALMVRLLDTPKTHSLVKRYYFFRNLFLLSKIHRVPFLWAACVIFSQVFFSICKTLFFCMEKQKWHTIKVLINSYLDGFFGRFGKTDFN